VYESIIGKNLKLEKNKHVYAIDNQVEQNMEIVKNGDSVVDGNNVKRNAECKVCK